MTQRTIRLLLLGALAIALAGCQAKPEFVPVEGTVTQGGKPLAGVTVEFHPEAGTVGPRSISSPTDEAGHYLLRSVRGEDGAVVGTHRVCIFDNRGAPRTIFGRVQKPKGMSKGFQEKEAELKKKSEIKGLLEPAGSSSRIPKCYNRPNETPLRVEVRPGEPVINLKVERIKLEIKFTVE